MIKTVCGLDFDNGITYYKVTNAEENHHDLQYHDGLNEDPIPFNCNGTCNPGGIYFTDIKHIFEFLSYGIYIREITIPNDALVHKEDTKYKASKLIFGKRMDINLDTVKYFIANGANVHADSDEVFKYAACSGHLDIIKYLLENDDSANITIKNDMLRCAANHGHLDIVRYIVENDGTLYIHDAALICAAEKGHLDIIKYLVEKGANVHAINNSVLSYAAEKGHLDVIKYLLENELGINTDMALVRAAEVGHLDVVKYLVEKGANIYMYNNCALRCATSCNYIDVVKYLVEKGANVHSCNDEALRYAAENGYIDMVKYLIANGADVHAYNDYALKWSARNDHLDVVKYLIANGADAHICDNDSALKYIIYNALANSTI